MNRVESIRVASYELQSYASSKISYDLKAIQTEWQNAFTLALDAYKARELAKLDIFLWHFQPDQIK